jgi:hypothetical protein
LLIFSLVSPKESKNHLGKKDLFCVITTDVQESVIGISRNIDKLLYVQHNQENEAILKWLVSMDYAL